VRRLLADLSFVEAPSPSANGATLELSVRSTANPPPMPSGARLRVADGLTGTAAGGEMFFSEGTSLLHVQAQSGRAVAELAPAFFDQPDLLRQRFWSLSVLSLLHVRGLFGLHAAALVNPAGKGLLLVGASGSGKSTLALGLLGAGWRYLSDDAVLLRQQTSTVEALALRKPFSVVHDARKRRLDVQAMYPRLYRPHCWPTLLVFPRIVDRPTSALRAVSRRTALGGLLAQSGPQFFSQSSMPAHLALLGGLVRQASCHELAAGRDLRYRPAELETLLAAVETR
jgi:hypothetical protein